jgi:intracellular sulfur oxidation DsrE/DsrF family protein
MMKKIQSLIIVSLLCMFALSANAAEQVKHRVLLQVSEDSIDKMVSALNTARNVQHIFGPENIEIQIVVYGPGVKTLKYYAPIPIADRIKEVTTEGVRVVACEIAMRTHKLRPSDMLQQVRYVQSGVAELIEKQTAGWSYIRP